MSFFKARSSYFYQTKIIEIDGFESFGTRLKENLQLNQSWNLLQNFGAGGPMVGVLFTQTKVSFISIRYVIFHNQCKHYLYSFLGKIYWSFDYSTWKYQILQIFRWWLCGLTGFISTGIWSWNLSWPWRAVFCSKITC